MYILLVNDINLIINQSPQGQCNGIKTYEFRRQPGREVQRAAGVTPRVPRNRRRLAHRPPTYRSRRGEQERETEAARDRERDSEQWITRLVHR